MTSLRFTDDGTFRMVAFPPSWLSIYAKPTGNGQYAPVTIADAMADKSVVAAIDGPMFANCDAGASYETSQCADPRYAQLDKSDRINDPPNRGNDRDGVSVSVVRGAAQWTTGGAIDTDASVGLQLYPALVANGVVSALSSDGSNGQRVGRAALLGLQDGSLAFATAYDTIHGFARRCRAAGAVWAGYTDGGGSTAMGYRPVGEPLRQWGNVSDPRPVAVFLVAKQPSYTAPILLGAASLALVFAIGYRRMLDA